MAIRVQLANKADMYHMPATGQCGFDLYLGKPGEQVFYKTSLYDHTQDYFEAPLSYRNEKKVIIYGTSNTQGTCASRPGMGYTNILSRRIPLEFMNLGFSAVAAESRRWRIS
ncbi:SGNH/GDSL hydrolase family protein [Paenibacillus dendritiformis]|uniref:SGNH/GDSL hydrolase family protein n=1 Tax=Paenibacillus dendritiformis TaxID=130049 RepID=UPI001F0E9361|nr:SGNH/GDSL hydrolase family protein [Paenibacillus dendritiformis]